MEQAEPGQLRKWYKNHGGCMFLIMSLDNEVYENGNGVNGPKISKIVWVLEENGNQVVYEIKAIERYSCIVS